MKRAALHGVLTAKYGDGAIRVVDELTLDAPKTRDLAGFLAALKANGRVLVVATGREANLEISARNLPQVDVIRADSLNVVDVLNADTLLITQPSLDTMAEVYA
jgi:large subunit ribosomal protein L4